MHPSFLPLLLTPFFCTDRARFSPPCFTNPPSVNRSCVNRSCVNRFFNFAVEDPVTPETVTMGATGAYSHNAAARLPRGSAPSPVAGRWVDEPAENLSEP